MTEPSDFFVEVFDIINILFPIGEVKKKKIDTHYVLLYFVKIQKFRKEHSQSRKHKDSF